MIRTLFALFVTLNFLACGSGGTDSDEGKNHDKQQPQNQETPAEALGDDNQTSPKPTPSLANKHLSIIDCIRAHTQAYHTTKIALEKLSCEDVTDNAYALLSGLPALTSLRITDTNLTGDDVETIATHINQAQMISLVLERDNLNKAHVDRLDPNFSYSQKHYTSLKYLSLKDNIIEGLLVVDYFPALDSLNLEGNLYPSGRLHHIGFIDNLKVFYTGDNPNIQNLDNMQDGPNAEASIEIMDISQMQNLNDIGELAHFSALKTLTIDASQETRFSDFLQMLKDRGVTIKIR